ncbi:MAG: metal-dependent hydrolase [Patescibacteria group bacterium]|nr:metal-dependent hydrolase [Patescibacteria group bacterium]
MDILSHALWTNLIFKELPMEQRGVAVLFGLFPDLISFSYMTVRNFFRRTLHFEAPMPSGIPKYVFRLYDITHSLVIWLAIFLILKILGLDLAVVIFYAWGLHIFLDIFTHTSEFFPTPILWPFSRFHFSGINWSNKWFMLFNYAVLLFMYLVFYF